MNEWGLALTVIALVITALCAATGVAVVHGVNKEKIRVLEERSKEHAAAITDAERRLAKGDTQFAIIAQSMKGIEDKLDAMMGMLTRAAKGRAKDDEMEN